VIFLGAHIHVESKRFQFLTCVKSLLRPFSPFDRLTAAMIVRVIAQKVKLVAVELSMPSKRKKQRGVLIMRGFVV
jgi:hypothetical protein